MATGTRNIPAPPPPPAPTAVVGRNDPYDRLIQQKLDTTRTHLKVVDLVSGLMGLIAFGLATLLVLAVIDHRILPLNFWGRLAGLAFLLLGCSYFFVTYIAVPLIQRINPLFAARAIEEARPSFKNSLINFLMLRTNRGSVRLPVFVAVERQAADQLSDIQVESTVDRSRVIIIGCILTAVLLLCGVYKILSTKDPLQSVQRILAPWARIDPSTRVVIIEVQPGSTRIYQGRTLTVTARVNHLGSDEPVNLFFTTADGQQLNRPVGMRPSEDGLRYECLLPPEEEGQIGIQQDFVYRIEAGDALSLDYQVKVVPAPSIVVQEVRYDYPRYTGRERTVQKMQGDIRALEGTRITVVARANLEIKSADIEFDQDRKDDADRGIDGDGTWSAGSLKRKPMKASGKDARVDFTLKLQADRRTAEHASYQLRFRTLTGDSSDQPVQHRIQVLPDLPPEVEILKPAEREVEVPQDGQLTIEVRANDADYGLSRIALRCVSGGQDLIASDLMNDPAGVPGQVIERYEFKPSALRLAVGDTAVVWAVAEDNRRAPETGAPAGNVSRTPNYQIRITSPENPPAGAEVNPDRQEDASDTTQEPAEQDRGSEEGETTSESRSDDATSSDPGEEGSDGQADQPDSAAGEDGNPPEDGQPSEGQPSEGQTGEGQTGEGQSGSEQTSEGQTGEGEGEPSGDPSDGASGGQSGSESGQPGSEQSGQTDGSGQSGTEGGESSDGAPNEGQSQAGDGQTGESRPSEGAGDGNNVQQRPLDHTGSEDGDVFDQVNRHREQDEGSTSQQSDSAQSSGDGSSQDSDGQQPSPAPGQENGPQDGSREPGDGQSPDEARQDNGSPQPGDQQGEGPGREGEPTENPGGQPQGGDVPQEQDSPDSSQQQDQRPGMGDNSESGAGNKPSDDQGAPESQGGREQRTGDQLPADDQHTDQNPNDPKSPANSSKPSESKGGESGDRKGGGDQGGGQGSKQPGHDSAGSSSGADEGSGADSEPGDGKIGERPGSGQPSERPTGQPGDEKGAGSTSQPGASGRSPGEASSEASSGEGPQDPSTGEGSAGEEPGTSSGPQHGTPDGSRGRAPGGDGSQQGLGTDVPPTGEGSPADAANLDYARKATDLALEHLEQMTDNEVRDVLGWSADQKRAFLQRWREEFRDAGASEESRRELDESLRSLGLRPRADRLERGASRADQPGGVQDTSRSAPPAEYRELFDAFKRGTARAAADQPNE